jgi:DNA-directed RNA polymerase specialized sigma24 family protein
MRLQGYRMGEIAAELGIDPSALRMRLSRLRKRLRQEKPWAEGD